MKFAETLSGTVLKIKIKNCISDFDFGSKNSRNLENTAEFPGWGTWHPLQQQLIKTGGYYFEILTG